MKRIQFLSAFSVSVFLALSACSAIANAATPIDFETGVSKGMIIDNQYEKSHGVQFSIVNLNTQAVTYPVIGETYGTDSGCGIAFSPGIDGGCGAGTSEGWVTTDGILPVKGSTKTYFDRLSLAQEPISMKTHAELVGKHFLAYPPDTVETEVYLRIVYTSPTEKLTFGIIDVDQKTEKWSVEGRDENGNVLVTKEVASDPNDYLKGDGEIRLVDFDVSGSGGAIKEVRIQYTGVPGPGLGFDAFSALDIATWICGDSEVAPGEGCDDGNTTAGDGCAQDCTAEEGYSCTGAPSECVSICGDGVVVADEACDDGNQVSGDGCSDVCETEEGGSSSSSGSGGDGGGGSGGGGNGGGGNGDGGNGDGGNGPDPDLGCDCQMGGESGGERGLGVIAMAALACLRRRRSV